MPLPEPDDGRDRRADNGSLGEEGTAADCDRYDRGERDASRCPGGQAEGENCRDHQGKSHREEHR